VKNLLLAFVIFFSACSQKIKKPQEFHLEKVGAKVGNPLYIRIFKEEKYLELWIKTQTEYQLYKTYPIKKLSGILGPKQYEGDKQNPEGIYVIYKNQLNPHSKFHLGINIGFPNRFDRNHARTGSNIMIHGGNQSIGCFAMGDESIEDIYALVHYALLAGQAFIYVAIYPFVPSEENLQLHKDSPWIDFWENLKEGYTLFNQDKIPPKVTVKGGRYLFRSAR